MNRFATRLAFAATMAATGLALDPSAHAVHLDPGGQGQVLLYPYYTVNSFYPLNRQQTLLSITNTSFDAQVVQMTFREALNGRAALQFKIWLGRKDVWTGTVFALADDGIASDGAGVLTRDPTCTTPMFSSGSLTSGGARYFPLGNQNYSGSMSDGGPTDLGRARHGWVEVISLANVLGAPAAAITFYSNGMPGSCAAVQNIALDPTNSARPSGGLIGTVSMIQVALGTILSTRAEALSGFTGISLYSNDPMQPAPNLASVNEGTPGGPVSAAVLDDQGRSQILTYGVPGSGSRPIDAVSAALMATRVKNEYQSDPVLGGLTDWVVTLPTKPFYTDPALIGASSAAMPPFDEAFQAPGTSRQCAPYHLFDNNQRTFPTIATQCSFNPFYFFGQPFVPIVGLFQAANVIPFLEVSAPPSSTGVVAATSPRGQILNLNLRWHVFPGVGPAGWMDMNLAPTNFNHRLPASAEGKVLSGLPTIGFSASNIVNNNVSNGVLANYASAVRHVTTVACTKASNQSPCD